MRTDGTGPARRAHPDAGAGAASPGEQARRVRPRTLDASAGDSLRALSPRGTPPGASTAESPRRSAVSIGPLQQWRSPGASGSAGPSGAAGALQGLSVEGRNTLTVHAAERAMHETGLLSEAEAKRYRSTFVHFADSLLQMRPPVGLEAFMERLNSPDPATREAAERLRTAYENGRTSSSQTRKELATCFRALSMVPPERRTSTLVEVLQRKAVARELKTLLPPADHGPLQQVQATERPSNSRAALEKQTLLIRLGVALRAHGHGGLSGWVQLHRQPDGSRLATELFERIKNGPELQLSRLNKRKLDEAAAVLRACNSLPAPAAPAAPAAASAAAPAAAAAFVADAAGAGPSAVAAPVHAAAASPGPWDPDELPLGDPGTPTRGDLASLGSLYHTDQVLSGTAAPHDDLLREFGRSPSPSA
jgi:hypothetical protein